MNWTFNLTRCHRFQNGGRCAMGEQQSGWKAWRRLQVSCLNRPQREWGTRRSNLAGCHGGSTDWKFTVEWIILIKIRETKLEIGGTSFVKLAKAEPLEREKRNRIWSTASLSLSRQTHTGRMENPFKRQTSGDWRRKKGRINQLKRDFQDVLQEKTYYQFNGASILEKDRGTTLVRLVAAANRS